MVVSVKRPSIRIVEVAQALTKVGDQWAKVAVALHKRRQQPFTTQQRSCAFDPTAPAQLRHNYGDDGDDCAKYRHERDQVLLRILTAPFDKAEVV